ncbi:MAG: uracil-DNA glycosylase family protein [Candidatus Thorarchaeota archaeon]
MVGKKVQSLVQEIQACKHCGDIKGNTPFIYAGSDSRLMVVSHVPHKGSFEENYGKLWAEGMINKGTPRTLFKWLDLDFEEAKRIIFWIQLMNCALDKSNGLDIARRDCSAKFIPRAIRTVKPKIIVTIGRPAAEWFFGGSFSLLSDLVGKSREYIFEEQRILLIAFPHPSGANRRWISENGQLLEKAKHLVRKQLER